MSIAIVLALLAGLAALVAIVVELRRAISEDGYGHRPLPRSLADDHESRVRTLSRLAG